MPKAPGISTPITMEPNSRKSNWAVWLPILLTTAGLIGGGFSWVWNQIENRRMAVRDENLQLNHAYLVPIQQELEETEQYSDRLKQDGVPGWGILESYVINAEQSGFENNKPRLREITHLVAANAKIVELTSQYEANSTPLTPEFSVEAKQYRDYARVYQDRFDDLPSYIQQRKQLPVWEGFPEGLPAAVAKEIEARKTLAREH
jgi:hypothetical protein